jgi:hypothetical protein
MTPPRRACGVLILGATLACIPARPALAGTTGISVEQAGCHGVDSDRVAELIALELTSAFGTSEHGLALSVTVACRPDALEIDVSDPVTDKTVGRKYPALAPDEREPERAIALAAAQLFVVSWLELLVPKKQRSAETDVASKATEDARTAASRSIEQPEPRGEFSVAGGVRLRALPDMVPVARVGLRGGGEVADRWNLFGQSAFEYGRATRYIGTADLVALWVGLGAARRARVSPFLSFQVGASLSAGYALLQGKPIGDGYHAGRIDGLTGELTVFTGPVLTCGRFVAAIDLLGGYALRNPVGTVEGEDDVSVGGFFFGAMLSLGLVVG